jgi:hypothetical protein
MAENKQQLSMFNTFNMFGWDDSAPAAKSPPNSETIDQWVYRTWKDFATPAWIKVLKESRESGDKRREAFALGVLRGVLEVKDIS